MFEPYGRASDDEGPRVVCPFHFFVGNIFKAPFGHVKMIVLSECNYLVHIFMKRRYLLFLLKAAPHVSMR